VNVLTGVDLNLLKPLAVLLESASVSRGAARLGLTQAATSNALRRLRDHFGDPLLVRVGRGMQLTRKAERLLPLARAALQSAARTLAADEAFDPTVARARVRVATSDHVESTLIEPLRARLGRVAPGLEVLVESFVPSAMDRAALGEVDLVVAPRARLRAPLTIVRLFTEPYALVGRRRHPVLRGTLDAEAMCGHDFVVVAPGGGSQAVRRTATDDALRKRGLERRVVRVVTSFAHALLLVSQSDLLVVTPWSFANRFAARLALFVRPPPLTLPPSHIDAGWSSRVHDDPLHGWLRRELAAVAAQQTARVREASADAARARRPTKA
jgi:DNA-binding transcriptional LysR family regulator